MLCCSVCVQLSIDYFPWSLVVDTAEKNHIQLQSCVCLTDDSRSNQVLEGKILPGVCEGMLHV